MEAFAESQGMEFLQAGVDDILPRFNAGDGAGIGPEHFPLLCLAEQSLARGNEGIDLMGRETEAAGWTNWIDAEVWTSAGVLRKAGALAGLALVLWIGGSVWYNGAVRARLERGEDLLRLAERLQKEERALQQLARTHKDFAGLFLFLAEALPEEVLVKTITLDTEAGVDLVLTGGGRQQTQDIVDRLNQSRFFRDVVEIRSANENDGFTVYLEGGL